MVRRTLTSVLQSGLLFSFTLGLFAFIMPGCTCVPPAGSCGSGCGGGVLNGGIIRPNYACDTGCVDEGPCGLGLSESGVLDHGCNCGKCGPKVPGLVANLASCRGACGEVYVDEWINEPPTPDNCGYDCGGCGQCDCCRPLLTVLKKLWGRPYHTSCDTSFLTGPSCGCDSCGGETIGYHGETYVSGAPSHSDCPSCQAGSGHAGVHVPSQTIPAQIAPYNANGHVHESHRSIIEPGVMDPPSIMQPRTPAGSAPLEVSPTAPSAPTPAPSMVPSSARRLNPAQYRHGIPASHRMPINNRM